MLSIAQANVSGIPSVHRDHGLITISVMMRGTANSGGIFAPTLRYHKGKYYLITTWFDIISPPDLVTRLPRSMYVWTKNIFDETSWR